MFDRIFILNLPLLACCLLLRVSGHAAECSFPFEPGSPVFGKVVIKGREFSAMFDTGVSRTIVSEAVTSALGLLKIADGTAHSPGGSADVDAVEGAPVALKGLPEIDSEWLARGDLSMMSAVAGREIAVVVGLDVMNGLILRLDHDKGLATFGTIELLASQRTDFASSMALHPCGFSQLGIRVEGFDFPAIFDTGSDGGFNVAKPSFDLLVDQKHALPFSSYTQAVTLAGAQQPGSAWLRRFALSGFPPIPVTVEEAKIGDAGTDRDAIIGMEVIQNWNWLIDFSGGKAYLSKSKYFGQPVLPDASGLGILRRGESIVIGRPPIPQSPAGEAGMRVGDVLIRCHGKPVGEWSLNALRREFCKPTGTKVSLQTERDGKKLDVTLTLKSPLDVIPK